MLLKVLPQPPRPIGGLHAQIRGNHQRMGNNGIKARQILMGPIPYGIIRRLVAIESLTLTSKTSWGFTCPNYGKSSKRGNNEIKARGIQNSPIPYGIT